MHSLMLAQTSVFEHQREMLLVEPTSGRLVFTFFEEPYVIPRWTKAATLEAGFATLEHFLLDVKRWWVEHPPAGS